MGFSRATAPTDAPELVPAAVPPQIGAYLTEQERSDPDVLAFLQRAYRAGADEKESDPADWTHEQKLAYAVGDWREFSRLRGYTAAEIENFGEYMRLARLLESRYGDDFAAGLQHDLSCLDLPQPS